MNSDISMEFNLASFSLYSRKGTIHLNPDQSSQSDEKKTHYITLRHFIISIFITIILTLLVTSSLFYLYIQYNQQNQVQANSQKLSKVYELIANDYYKKQDKDELVNQAIKGMTNSLHDPYTEYLTKEETDSFNENISGDFVGIGAEMEQKGDKIYIATPLKDSPAEKAGLKPKDELVKIDNKSIKGQKLSAIIPKVRGKKGSEVQLTIQRNNDQKTFSIKRDTVHVESVKHEKHQGVDVFKISKFQQGTSGELKLAIQDALQKGSKHIILDLRNNPGGLLDEAVKMANIFLEKDQVVVQLEKDGQNEKIRTSNAPLKNIDQVNVSILLNKGSASASEVFAGALKDHKIAQIYGETSFGKGIVQTTREFSDGSLLKFTEMKWLTPHHHYIHNKGIAPDVQIKGAAYEDIKEIPNDQVFKLGDDNVNVRSIKIGLKALNYDINNLNNFYDESLEQAVISFQKQNNIPVNGEFDSETNRAFIEQLVQKSSQEDSVLDKMIQKLKS
ncbi:serine protease [Staphylococcus felis]|nr:S41 family peptidase [Staphylococcus felis]REH89812.1 serine protease [Staphylococcus felis]